MKKIEELRRYFTKGERALWFGSVFVIIAAFYFFDRSNYFTLFALPPYPICRTEKQSV